MYREMFARSALAEGRRRSLGTALQRPGGSLIQRFDLVEDLVGGKARPWVVPGRVDLFFQQPSSLFDTDLVLFEQPQARAHDLACILIPSLGNALADEFLEMVAQIDARHPHASYLSLIHISEPTRQAETSYAVFC